MWKRGCGPLLMPQQLARVCASRLRTEETQRESFSSRKSPPTVVASDPQRTSILVRAHRESSPPARRQLALPLGAPDVFPGPPLHDLLPVEEEAKSVVRVRDSVMGLLCDPSRVRVCDWSPRWMSRRAVQGCDLANKGIDADKPACDVFSAWNSAWPVCWSCLTR